MRRIIREEEPPQPSTRLSTLGRAADDRLGQPQGRRRSGSSQLVRGELDWIVMKALEKDRSRRYETANDFAADVQRYLTDEPVRGVPAVGVVPVRASSPGGTSGRSLTAVGGGPGGGAGGGGQWSALHLAGTDAGPAPSATGARGQSGTSLLPADRPGGARMVGEQPEPDGRAARRVPGGPARLGMALPQAAAVRRPSPLRHESAVYSVAFSPDGQYLATATQDGVVRIWQAKTGQELRKWPAHETNATGVAFSPDGRYLATGGWDATVKVWDVETVLQGEVHEPLLQLEHTSRVRVWSVAFSPDGQRLASAGGRTADEKGEVKVWDLNTRQEVLTLSRFTDSGDRCVRFSPDGRRLATAGPGLVQLWDAQTGQEQLTLRGHDTGARRGWPSAPTAAASPRSAAFSRCIPTRRSRSGTPRPGKRS